MSFGASWLGCVVENWRRAARGDAHLGWASHGRVPGVRFCTDADAGTRGIAGFVVTAGPEEKGLQGCSLGGARAEDGLNDGRIGEDDGDGVEA